MVKLLEDRLEEGKTVDVKAYEESPPHDAGAKEFRYSQWFIDEKWRVIAEPPLGRKSGKTKAFVWNVDQKFSKKTLGKGSKREESLVVSGFLLDANLYKKWDTLNFWKEHQGVKKDACRGSKRQRMIGNVSDKEKYRIMYFILGVLNKLLQKEKGEVGKSQGTRKSSQKGKGKKPSKKRKLQYIGKNLAKHI